MLSEVFATLKRKHFLSKSLPSNLKIPKFTNLRNTTCFSVGLAVIKLADNRLGFD